MNLENSHLEAETTNEQTYEAPAIESVLTPEALEREVHYAGTIPASQAKG